MSSAEQPKKNVMADLADMIERVWLRRWGKVPVVAAVVLDRMRRGDS
jgi:hypothetical protein